MTILQTEIDSSYFTRVRNERLISEGGIVDWFIASAGYLSVAGIQFFKSPDHNWKRLVVSVISVYENCFHAICWKCIRPAVSCVYQRLPVSSYSWKGLSQNYNNCSNMLDVQVNWKAIIPVTNSHKESYGTQPPPNQNLVS